MLNLLMNNEIPYFPITSYKHKVMIPSYGLSEPPQEHRLPSGQSLCLKPYRIMRNVREISASHNNNLCIDMDDVLWMWGAKFSSVDVKPYHELSISYSNPDLYTVEYVPQKCMEGVLTADAGAWHTLAVTKDGTLWAWGKNNAGQLGCGNCTDSIVPISIMDHVRSVFASEQQSFAIKEDGSLWGWGYNGRGILLDAPEFCTVPHLLMENVESISASPEVVLAIKADHTLWGWGSRHAYSFFFQENPVKNYPPTPLALGATRVSVAKIWGNDTFSFLISEGGELFVLGNRGGPGNPIWQFKVSQTDGLYKLMDGTADAEIGYSFSIIRMQDGRVFSMGYNYAGQCGDGKSSGYRTKLVPLASDAIDIAAGYSHGMLLQENGDLWIWGGDYGFAK